MGTFNDFITDTACPACGSTYHNVIQYKFGYLRLLVLRPGDEVPLEDHDSAWELCYDREIPGYGRDCPQCGQDGSEALISIRDGRFTGARYDRTAYRYWNYHFRREEHIREPEPYVVRYDTFTPYSEAIRKRLIALLIDIKAGAEPLSVIRVINLLIGMRLHPLLPEVGVFQAIERRYDDAVVNFVASSQLPRGFDFPEFRSHLAKGRGRELEHAVNALLFFLTPPGPI